MKRDTQQEYTKMLVRWHPLPTSVSQHLRVGGCGCWWGESAKKLDTHNGRAWHLCLARNKVRTKRCRLKGSWPRLEERDAGWCERRPSEKVSAHTPSHVPVGSCWVRPLSSLSPGQPSSMRYPLLLWIKGPPVHRLCYHLDAPQILFVSSLGASPPASPSPAPWIPPSVPWLRACLRHGATSNTTERWANATIDPIWSCCLSVCPSAWGRVHWVRQSTAWGGSGSVCMAGFTPDALVWIHCVCQKHSQQVFHAGWAWRYYGCRCLAKSTKEKDLSRSMSRTKQYPAWTHAACDAAHNHPGQVRSTRRSWDAVRDALGEVLQFLRCTSIDTITNSHVRAHRRLSYVQRIWDLHFSHQRKV